MKRGRKRGWVLHILHEGAKNNSIFAGKRRGKGRGKTGIQTNAVITVLASIHLTILQLLNTTPPPPLPQTIQNHRKFPCCCVYLIFICLSVTASSAYWLSLSRLKELSKVCVCPPQ